MFVIYELSWTQTMFEEDEDEDMACGLCAAEQVPCVAIIALWLCSFG